MRAEFWNTREWSTQKCSIFKLWEAFTLALHKSSFLNFSWARTWQQCVCVCVLQALGCSNLSKIWHTYSLGWIIRMLFSFYGNFDFWGLGKWSLTLNGLETFRALQGKCKLLNLFEIWPIYRLGESLVFFLFLEFFIFGPWWPGPGS